MNSETILPEDVASLIRWVVEKKRGKYNQYKKSHLTFLIFLSSLSCQNVLLPDNSWNKSKCIFSCSVLSFSACQSQDDVQKFHLYSDVNRIGKRLLCDANRYKGRLAAAASGTRYLRGLRGLTPEALTLNEHKKMNHKSKDRNTARYFIDLSSIFLN